MTEVHASGEGHPTIFRTIRTMAGPVKVLMLGTFVNNLASFLNAFLVLFLTHHRGISSAYAGLALTALLVGRIVGTAVGGGIADRVGYRWTIIGSTFLACGATITLVQMSSPWAIIAVAGLAGIVLQAYRPASIAWIVELTPERSQVLVFSIYRLAFNVGATVGPLAGALIITYSFDLLFYANAATELSFGLVALLFLPSDSTGRKARKASAAAGTEAEASTESKSAAEQASGGYRRMLGDGRFMLVVGGLFFTAVAYIQIASALPLFVTGTGYGTNDYAILLSLNGAMVIVLEVLLTKWTQRIPIGIPMAGGMALLSIGHFLYLFPAGLQGLAVATFVWTLGEIVAAPSMQAYPGLRAPAGLKARYIAGATVSQQLGYAAGPIIGVTAWQMWGSKVWLVTGACAAVATVLTIIGAGTRRRPAAGSPDATAPATDAPVPDSTATDPSAAGTTPKSSSVSTWKVTQTMSKPVVAVVQPYTSASLIAPAARAQGMTTVAVMDYSGPELAPLHSSHNARNYDAIINHHGDYEGTLARLAALKPTAIVPGVEASLVLADSLCAELTPDTANPLELGAARRHKYRMHQALAAAGLPIIKQICTANADEVAEWIVREGLAGQDLVIKPATSAGTIGVTRAARGEGWREQFMALLGQQDKLGVLAEEVLVQEHMTGTECVVDTVSYQGRHSITDMLKYRRIQFGDGMAVYDSVEWIPYDTEMYGELINYALAALDAVGLRNWAAHTEVMMTPNGPRLLEINARLAGAGNPNVTMIASGESQVTRIVDVCAGRGPQLPPGFQLQRNVTAVFLMAPSTGIVRNAEIFDKARDLPSFHTPYHLVGSGDRVEASTDLFSMTMGYIILAHDSAEQIQADRLAIREIEKGLIIDPVTD